MKSNLDLAGLKAGSLANAYQMSIYEAASRSPCRFFLHQEQNQAACQMKSVRLSRGLVQQRDLLVRCLVKAD